MIEINIPGQKTLQLEYLILDYNGTVAVDGKPIKGVKECLDTLAEKLEVHVVTADTFGSVKTELAGFRCELTVLPADNQDRAKRDLVERLGAEQTVSIGNGRNDSRMVKKSALGIAVIQEEGAASDTVASADVVCSSILAALGLLLNPIRLVATLRS